MKRDKLTRLKHFPEDSEFKQNANTKQEFRINKSPKMLIAGTYLEYFTDNFYLLNLNNAKIFIPSLIHS